MAIEAFRIALKYMTPVVFLSDGFLANGSEPWRIPIVDDLPDIRVDNATDPRRSALRPRPETLARPWAVPGTPGLEHRIGGLEKADITGNVSYDPENHHRMQMLRAREGRGDRRRHPGSRSTADQEGDLLVLGWGSTYGAIRSAVERRRPTALGGARAPAPPEPVPRRTPAVLLRAIAGAHPGGQPRPAALLIRAKFLVDAIG